MKKILTENIQSAFSSKTLPRAGYYFINHPKCPLTKTEKKEITQEWHIPQDPPAASDFRLKQKQKIDNFIHKYQRDVSFYNASNGVKTAENCKLVLEWLEHINNHKFFKDSSGFWVYAEDNSKICKYYNGYKVDSDQNKGTSTMFNIYVDQQLIGDTRFDDTASNAIIQYMPDLQIPTKKRFISFEDKIFDGLKFCEIDNNDYIIPRHHFNFKYNPNAKLTPRMKEELMAWSNNEKETFYRLIECVGYTLFPNTFKIAVWLLGYSNSGKSTFINEILKKIHHNQTSVVDITETDRFSFQPFLYSTLNISSEPGKKTINEATIKKMVGGDGLLVDIKGKSPINMPPEEIPAIIINTNQFMKTTLTDSVINKIAIINFKNIFNTNKKFKPFNEDDLKSIILYSFNYILKHKNQLKLTNLNNKEYNHYVKQLCYSTYDYISLSCAKSKSLNKKDCLVINDLIEQIKKHKKSLQIEPDPDIIIYNDIVEAIQRQFRGYNSVTEFVIDNKTVRGFEQIKFTPLEQISELYTKTKIKKVETTQIDKTELDEFETWVLNQDVQWNNDNLEIQLWHDAFEFAKSIGYKITEEKYWIIWKTLRNGMPRPLYTDAYTEWQQKQSQ